MHGTRATGLKIGSFRTARTIVIRAWGVDADSGCVAHRRKRKTPPRGVGRGFPNLLLRWGPGSISVQRSNPILDSNLHQFLSSKMRPNANHIRLAENSGKSMEPADCELCPGRGVRGLNWFYSGPDFLSASTRFDVADPARFLPARSRVGLSEGAAAIPQDMIVSRNEAVGIMSHAPHLCRAARASGVVPRGPGAGALHHRNLLAA